MRLDKNIKRHSVEIKSISIQELTDLCKAQYKYFEYESDNQFDNLNPKTQKLVINFSDLTAVNSPRKKQVKLSGKDSTLLISNIKEIQYGKADNIGYIYFTCQETSGECPQNSYVRLLAYKEKDGVSNAK